MTDSNIPPIPPKIQDIIGIKFGSRTTVLGTVKNHAVDTLNISNRVILSMVSFTNNLRTYNESAQISYLKNISSTYTCLSRLIGLQYEPKEFIEHERKFMLFDYELNKETNEYLYECKYKYKLPIENIIVSFLMYLSKTWSNSDNNLNVSGIVISVPDYFTLYQKQILLNIIKISNLNCLSLLNESSSVCLSYFLHHYKNLSNSKQKIICFIDLGECKLSLHLCSFTNEEAKVLYSKSNKFIGCRDFDLHIFEFLQNTFVEEMKTISKNPKTKIKLLQVIEKSRKMITVNKESVINYEVGDSYINYVLTREKFKEIINDKLELFKSFIDEFFQESKTDIKSVDNIEMVGDMIRNPVFQEILMNLLQKNINKTMVADECIAQGCAFYAALLDGHYSPISNFNLVQYLNYDILFSLKGNIMLDINKQLLIQKGDNYPVRKAYKFKNEFIKDEEAIQVFFRLNDEKEISKYEIRIGSLGKLQKNKDFYIDFLVDSNGFPSVADCYFCDENGYLSDKIFYKKVWEYNVSNFSCDELIKNEINMEFIDFETIAKNSRKNEIESLLYHLRNENALEAKFDINDKIEKILELNDLQLLDEEYNKLIEQYKLKDKLKEEHDKHHIIFKSIKDLLEEDKGIDINEFNKIGKKICKAIDKLDSLKKNEIDELVNNNKLH